tara:strand:- start:42 stop:587 length:546 start_codon:yes stop_codon:yes gene_type:complete
MAGLEILEKLVKFAKAFGGAGNKGSDTKSEEIIIDKYNISQGALDSFSETVAGIESDYGKNLKNPNSTAKGIYHFTDDSFDTAVQRAINLYKSAGENIPTWLTDAKKKGASVMNLTDDQQKDLFFANLAKHPGKTMDLLKQYDQGDEFAGFDLFAKYHHTKGYDSPTKERAYSFFGIGPEE